MNRDSTRAARRLIAATLVLAVWPAVHAFAQGAAPQAPAAGGDAATEQPRSARDRRRAARAETAQAQPRAAENVAATPAAAAAEPSGAVAENAETEVVCKTIKPTGSRVGRKVCGTPEQWAALDKKTSDAAEEDMRQVRGQTAVMGTTPGPAVGPP